MAATVKVERQTGSGAGSATDITSINTRAQTNDTHTTAGTTNPIPIVTGQTKRSFWVSTRLDATVTPAGTINNLKWYTDGSNSLGTGVTMEVADASTGANSGYRQASGTTGDTGDQLTTGNHSGLDNTPVNAFTLTSGSPMSLGGSLSNPSTGQFGDFVVYQISVADTASPGATATETLTFQWDET